MANFEQVVKTLQEATTAYQRLWSSIIGCIPCIPCLTLHLHSNNALNEAPNLVRLLHNPLGQQHLQRLDEIKDEINDVIVGALSKDPNAFRCNHISDETSSIQHEKGCNCRKSGWVKKYCECFQANIPWGSLCKCLGCKNCAHTPNQADMSPRYSNRGQDGELYANTLIESLSKSLVKELENSNNNFVWEKALNTSNSVNTLWDILNRNHSIGSIPPLPVLKKDLSSNSESSVSSSNSHSFIQKLNLQNKKQNKAFGEFVPSKSTHDTSMVGSHGNYSNKIKFDKNSLLSPKPSNSNRILERNISTLLFANTSKSGKVDYLSLYKDLDAKNSLLKLQKSRTVSVTSNCALSSANELSARNTPLKLHSFSKHILASKCHDLSSADSDSMINADMAHSHITN